MSFSDIYLQQFGLRQRPFTLLPDPDFLFWTGGHRRAYSVLEYGILSRAPITVITGEVGTGKTTLVQALLSALDEEVTVGLISNAQGGRGELVRWILNALSIDHPTGLDYVGLFQLLQDFLLTEYAEGRYVVLIIDEAQNLSFEALEELRMLTNVNSNKDELLQLILVGQPELREMVEDHRLRQFAQRVVASYHLNPMDPESVGDYVRHRLYHAGGTGEEFTPEAIDLIARASGGIPRLVNKMCDISMVFASATETGSVDRETVEDVLREKIFIETRPADGTAGKIPASTDSET